MKPYADTNFLVRIYLPLPESGRVDRLLGQARSDGADLLPVTWLHRMELANALEMSVWLGRQGGHPRITSQNSAVAFEHFKEDLEEEAFVTAAALELSALQPLFEDLVARHTAKHGFRTYDMIHVASALLMGCDTFLSFDVKATKLAQLEGLKTVP